MPNPIRTTHQQVPEAFNQLNQKRAQRTVRLTEAAIAHLNAKGKPITLTALCEATRKLDEKGKGLQPITILRNSKAAELFRQHSPAYQARQQAARKAKRKRSPINSEARSIYRGLHSSDLIQMAEDLKLKLAELQTQQKKVVDERDEAYRQRDEALQQNLRQLAALAKLTGKVPFHPGGQ